MSGLPPSTALAGCDWVPRAKLKPLARLGLETVEDLLRHFPRRHEDRTTFDRFPEQVSDVPVCVCGLVASTSLRRFGPRRIFEAVLEEADGGLLARRLACRWFNSPWVPNMLAEGDRVVVFAKPRIRSGRVVFEHPEFEVVEEESGESIHFDRLTPVHPAGDGLTPRLLRQLIHRALAEVDASLMEPLWKTSAAPKDAAVVWRAIHFPASAEEFEAAREAVVADVFFGVQIVLASRREAFGGAVGVPRPGTGRDWNAVLASLPFEPTASQLEVMEEVSRDMASDRRMNRLLQGDVGSGKTLVALRAMLQARESGWSAALMAPTQILAEQHYLNFRRLLEPLGIPVLLRTSARRAGVEAGDGMLPGFGWTQGPPLVIGTHALLFDGADLGRNGLVVIDEQHKFGVLQRSRLIARAEAPDVLVMTATPIPRTITQTVYGDLDVSTIKERPAGRGKVVTAVREESQLPAIIDFLRGLLADGRQAYIVYPLVEESEKLASKAATVEFGKWSGLLAPATVGLVHGRMDSDAKEAVMADFRDGSIGVLVATTVIEVGVDVPNACFMLVEDAGRFGLSQLHQLRGRIGRGAGKSWCVLLRRKDDANAASKLSVLEATDDGFEIAEADLALRGPGDLLGTAQTGLPPFEPGDLVRDAAIMAAARAEAMRVVSGDPHLEAPGHARLKRFVESRAAASEAAAG
jgi:ATP-dependent DNA helicase RecG